MFTVSQRGWEVLSMMESNLLKNWFNSFALCAFPSTAPLPPLPWKPMISLIPPTSSIGLVPLQLLLQFLPLTILTLSESLFEVSFFLFEFCPVPCPGRNVLTVGNSFQITGNPGFVVWVTADHRHLAIVSEVKKYEF